MPELTRNHAPAAQSSSVRLPSAWGRLRFALFLLAALMCAGLVLLLGHSSTQPRWLGRYSSVYMLVLGLHLLGTVGCAALALWGRSRADDVVRFARSPGSLFFGAAGWLLAGYLLSVHLRSGDQDFFTASILVFDLTILVWLAAAWHGVRCRVPLALLALAAGGVILALGIIELIVAVAPGVAPGLANYRAAQIRYFENKRRDQQGTENYKNILELDPELGFRQRANELCEIAALNEAGEDVVTIPIKMDRLGYTNSDEALSPPCDVAVVGDSFVAASWPVRLGEITGKHVAALGVAGYCPPQYSIVVRRHALPLNPRILLYCLYANDVVESAAFERWRASGQDWFTWKAEFWFPTDPHPGRALLRHELTSVSRIYALLQFISFKRRLENEGTQRGLYAYSEGDLRLNFDPNCFGWMSDPAHPDFQQGMPRLTQAMQDARDACVAAGVRMVVLLLPPKELVYWDALKSVVPPETPIENVARQYAGYAAAAQSLGLEYYDLTEEFRAAAAQRSDALYWQTDLHWNPAGNDAMAQITKDLLARIQPDVAPITSTAAP